MQQVLSPLPEIVDFSIVSLGPELLEPVDFLLNVRLFPLEPEPPQGPHALVSRGWSYRCRGSR